MGRREKPVSSPNQALAALAMWLRSARANTGMTYTNLAERAGYHATTLQRAAAGQDVPSRKVVIAYAQACSARADHAEQLWKAARYEERRSVRDRQTSLAAPRPELVRDFADLSAVLIELYDKAGAPPLRQMQEKASEYGLLPRSTAHRIVNKQAVPHSRRQFEAFLRACDVREEDRKPWLDAWGRAWRKHHLDRGDVVEADSVHDDLYIERPALAKLRLKARRQLEEAGYVPNARTGDPRRWRVRCLWCSEAAPINPETLNRPIVLCSCRRPSSPRQTAQLGTLGEIIPARATEKPSPKEESLWKTLAQLKLAHSRLRSPLGDRREELRAIAELQQAVRATYVMLAERGRIDSDLRSESQQWLSRCTDLLQWLGADHVEVPSVLAVR
jgi:transcriptional regulator with XRE-family HTH domain